MKLTVSLSKAYDALTEEESAKFHAWFGKSVVRDSKGKPIRCFHGTPHQFDKFDLNFAAKGNDQYGIGFYFTDNADVASTYSGENGSVLPCYLKIVKPIDFDRPRNITQLQITKLVSAIGPKLMKDALSNHIDVDSVGFRVALNQYAKFYEGTDLLQAARGIWNDIYEGTPLAGHFPKLFKAVTGYDGIIVRRSNGNIYVVFTPQQIKSAVGNDGRYTRAAELTR